MASILLLLIVFALDLIAFALSVAAEIRKSTAKVINEGTSLSCHYDSAIATGLGVGAFVFLLASQLLMMRASRSLCCGRGPRPGGSGAISIMLFVSWWMVFLVAEACLLAGSVQNAYHSKYGSILSNPSCQTLRKGVFGAGAAFIVFTCIISEFYYVSYSKANNFTPMYAGDTDLMMGDL